MMNQISIATNFRFAGLVIASGLGLLLLSGCQDATDANLVELRQRLLADALPLGVKSLEETHAEFEEGMTVRVVGRIFADGISPFDQDSASFSLIELPKPGHDHENPGDCPFCKRDMENAATAIIQVVDDEGQVVNAPADKLLQLKKNQDIVVEGEATRVGEMLVVDATKVHILGAEDCLALANRIHGTPED